MKNDPSISVILPFFNAAPFLEQAISSILQQTLQDFELICINDGSTDESLTIIEQNSKRDARIKKIELPENKGISTALNIGITCANGRYIARMDADDIAFPNRLKIQKEYLDAHTKTALTGTKVMGINSGGRRLLLPGPLATQNTTLKFISLFTAPFNHPSIMARADLFKSFPYSESSEHKGLEDYELWQRILFAGIQATNLPVPLLAYRMHQRSITAQKATITNSKDTLFCQSSLSKRLAVYLDIETVAAVRGKQSGTFNEVKKKLEFLFEVYKRNFSVTKAAEAEIINYNNRVLSELAFKNLRTRQFTRKGKSLHFLLKSRQSREYLYSRSYNFLTNLTAS